MAKTSTGTIVQFAQGTLEGDSVLTESWPVSGPDGEVRTALIVERTPFHPVDHRWPDQPGDFGSLTVDGLSLPVVDCVIGMLGPGTDKIQVADAITVRRDEPGWQALVLHIVPDDVSGMITPLLGRPVHLSVDAERRRALSVAHTVCHLSGLAVDKVLADLWRKEIPVDSLGSPAFEELALVSSAISPTGFRDVYRIGKSLRKKGFDSAGLTERVEDLGHLVTQQVRTWLASRAPIRIETAGPLLADRRTWTCDLPGGPASVSCGGTHPANLGEVGSADIDIRFAPDDTTQLIALATVVPAPADLTSTDAAAYEEAGDAIVQ